MIVFLINNDNGCHYYYELVAPFQACIYTNRKRIKVVFHMVREEEKSVAVRSPGLRQSVIAGIFDTGNTGVCWSSCF